MVILSEGCKPDNLELHKSLKLCCTNIWGLCSNFVDCESFLESNSADSPTLFETNLDDSIDCGSFSVRGLSSFNPKGFYYSYAWSCCWCEVSTSFWTGRISRKLCRWPLFKLLASFTTLSVFLLLPVLITFFIFLHSFWFCFIWHRFDFLDQPVY